LSQRRQRAGRQSGVEVLEVRWLLAVDVSPYQSLQAAANAAAIVAYPTARVLHTDFFAEPHGSAGPVGMTPAMISHAYGFDQIMFGNIVGDGAGQTIAIVDAYDTPTIWHDLQAFDAAFGIPDPPSFIRIAQDGSTNYPPVDPAGPGGNNWEVETALDVEWVHALAPKANIILVEANSNGADLWVAVNYARSIPNVSVVSMSFGGSEAFRNDSLFTTPAGHNGVTFVASTGDDGVPGGYPAFSPNVLAVGGTTLTLDASYNITNETGWSGSGGGISQYVPQPNYQAGIATQSTVYRTIPDVSFDANPSTGAAIYDSYNNGTTTPWSRIGGTSFSAPSWAALIAIADQGRTLNGLPTLDGRGGTLPAIYAMPSSNFRDITSGNNGMAAGTGYDLVTGRGSPKASLVAASLVAASSISGTVFADTNNDGVQQNTETGLGGWTAYDDLNNNGVLDPPAYTTVASTFSPALSIPDATSNVTSTLDVGDLHGSILDINVNFTIHHTRDSNLTVTLISPAGTSVLLVNHNGSTGANFINTNIDDQAGTAISSGTAPFTATYRPSSVLSALIGQNPQGTWKLVVADTVSGNTGVLDNWSLKILTPSEPSVSTSGDGGYEFRSAAAGTHHIRVVTPTGFAPTGSTPGVYDLTTAAGVISYGDNFAALGSALSGKLFFDPNANGTQELGEVGLAWVAFDDRNNNGAYDSTSLWSGTSTDAPKSIADQSTILSTLTINGVSGAISDLNVNLTLHHTRDSDLAITLISPDGTYIPLTNHNGGTGANFLNTTFDDQAATAITSGSAPFSNTYRPSSVLSTLNGKNPNGVWKLLVADTVANNSGTLDGWSLQITTNAAEPYALSDYDGNYQFSNLIAGVHHIRQAPTPYTTLTAPASGVYDVTVSAQTNFTGRNFGNLSSILASTGGPYTINEGSSLSLNGSASGGSEPYTFTWDLNGDGVYGDAEGATPTLDWNQLVALGITNGPSVFNIRLRVDDADTNIGISTTSLLTVNNAAPTANAGGPYTINEEDGLSLAGSGTDPVDSLNYSWDINGDGTFGDAMGAAPTLTWNQLVALGVNNGPSTFNIKLRVDDGDGGVTISTPALLTVNNVAPTADAGGPYTISEGEGLSLAGSGTDPVDALSYSWDINGDGTFGDAMGAAPSLTWNQLVALGVNNGPNTFNVKLRVDDGDGGVTISTPVLLTVNNVAPTVDAGGPYTINEGDGLSLSGAGADPADVLSYSWDINGDGTFGDAVGAAPTVTWNQLVALGINNGPSTFNVKLRVDDGDGGVAVSTSTLLTVNNVAPTANAGGPYTINEGEGLSLAGSGADPADTLGYSWDLNGDDTFGDAVGASPTLTWNQLVALGINNGPGTFNVKLRVDDGDGGVTISTPVALTVQNVAPTIGIAGTSTALRGDTQLFTLTVADVAADQAAGFTFAINWGDGSPVQTATGLSGLQVPHAFNKLGSLTISVTATEQDGATSTPAALGVQVDAVQLRPNAQNPALLDLVWGGASGNDTVQFTQLTQLSATSVRVHEMQINGAAVDNVQDFSGVTGRVIALGNAGNDALDARGLATTSATLDGGAGNNTLYGGNGGDTLIGGSNGGEGKQGSNVIIAGNGDNTIYGNSVIGRKGVTGGNNLIVGGSGHDTIYGAFGANPTGNGGEGGQNLIVGGGGGDTIYASQITDGAEGGHGSILIDGTTSLNQAALQAVLAEWTSARSLTDKIANITGTGSGSRNNGNSFLLPGMNVASDGVPDQITSDTNGSANWLLLKPLQDTTDRVKPTDVETNLP